MSSKKKPRSDAPRPPWKPPVAASQVMPVMPVVISQHKPKRERVADEIVEEIPAHCPRCKSTDRTRKEGSLTRNLKGIAKDGRPFNRLRWSYCKCLKCGQAYRVISREMTGE